MRVVAVSQRVDFFPERNERRDALDQYLVTFIASCGAMAIPVPNTLASCNLLGAWLDFVKPSAVLLSGGNTIGECPDRDLTERLLLDHAKTGVLPVLGICRGMQMLGVWAGVELKTVTNHVHTRHQLTGRIEGEVNSFHNQVLIDLPSEFIVLARSEDGEIEAIRHDHLPWEGWMWHPERELPFSFRDVDRLRELFS